MSTETLIFIGLLYVLYRLIKEGEDFDNEWRNQKHINPYDHSDS